jgi:hypothetical protein
VVVRPLNFTVRRQSVQKTIDATISLRSWVFLGGMLGFCFGVVSGVVSAAYEFLWKHDGAAEAGGSLIGALVFSPIAFAVFALIGYPVYRFALCRSARYRVLHISTDERVS